MTTLSLAPAALVPSLPDVLNRRRKHVVTDLQGGDQLHATSALLGFKRGAVLPIYGYCVLTDESGQAYSVRAYVRPVSMDHAVAFDSREAVRFPTNALGTQQEYWFGSYLMYLTEIDLTDYADCLRLERLSARVLPLLVAPEYSHVEAA
jgi:hypothetical protein